MTCPNCRSKIKWNRRAFRRGFTCHQCGSEVSISEAYSRMLVLVSLLVGFGLVWLPVVEGHGGVFLRSYVAFLALLALGFPMAGGVLFLLVRLAPVVVSPPMVIRHSGPAYGLGLGRAPSSIRQRFILLKSDESTASGSGQRRSGSDGSADLECLSVCAKQPVRPNRSERTGRSSARQFRRLV